jgi:hypothetical protein
LTVQSVFGPSHRPRTATTSRTIGRRSCRRTSCPAGQSHCWSLLRPERCSPPTPGRPRAMLQQIRLEGGVE